MLLVLRLTDLVDRLEDIDLIIKDIKPTTIELSLLAMSKSSNACTLADLKPLSGRGGSGSL